MNARRNHIILSSLTAPLSFSLILLFCNEEKRKHEQSKRKEERNVRWFVSFFFFGSFRASSSFHLAA